MPDEGRLSLAEADVVLNRFASRGVDPESVLALEHAFRLPLEGSPATLDGRLDRVDLEGAGGDAVLHVVDYKAGTRKIAEAALADDLQMKFYVTAARRLFGTLAGRIRFTFRYLRDLTEASFEAPRRDSYVEEIAGHARRIAADGAFERRPAPRCRRCPALGPCAPDLRGFDA